MSKPSRTSLLTGVVAGCAIVASLAAARTTPAKTTITGDVTSDSGTSLPGMIVSVDGRRDSATTDMQGRFVLRDVPRGVVSLRVRGAGFRELLVPSLPVGSDTLHFAVALHPASAAPAPIGHMGPVVLIRHSVDSLTATVVAHASHFFHLDESLFEAVNVIKRPRSGKWYGANAESGVIFMVMKPAKGFRFWDIPLR